MRSRRWKQRPSGNERASLPNAQAAYVPDRKIRDYLLNPNHPGNGGQADFFLRFGFSSRGGRYYGTPCRITHGGIRVAKMQSNPYGTRYVVCCNLNSPDGRNPCIVRVWVIDSATTWPRFVTAFP